MLRSQTMQRAVGQLNVTIGARSDRTIGLKDLREQGSLRCIFPRTRDGAAEAVILNTAGGIAGGDRFGICAEAHPGAHLTLTTQAAERAYGVADDTTGQLRTRLTVGQGAQLHWLPQETILFDGSRLTRRLDVDVAPDASFIMVEPVIFGREASGEVMHSGLFDDRVAIRCAGRLIYKDAVHLSGDFTSILKGRAVAQGARAMASAVFFSPQAGARLDAVRALLPATGGASMLGENLMYIRTLAANGFALRQTLLPLLMTLTDNTVPKNWRL